MKKILITNRCAWIVFLFSMVLLAIFLVDTKFFPVNETGSNYGVDFTSSQISISETVKYPEPISNTPTVDNPSINKTLTTTNKIHNKNSNVKLKDLGAYISRFPSQLTMAFDLQERFDADEINYATASESESDLAYIFYQGMEWQEFSPNEIICKSTICRIKLKTIDENNNTKLVELISKELMSSRLKYAYALPVSLPVEGITYIYFIKN